MLTIALSFGIVTRKHVKMVSNIVSLSLCDMLEIDICLITFFNRLSVAHGIVESSHNGRVLSKLAFQT